MDILVVESNDYKYSILEYYLKKVNRQDLRVTHVTCKQDAMNQIMSSFRFKRDLDVIILGSRIREFNIADTMMTEDLSFDLLKWITGFPTYKIPVIVYGTFDHYNYTDEMLNSTLIAEIPFRPDVETNEFTEALNKVKPMNWKNIECKNKVARFEKVSLEEYVKDMTKTFPQADFSPNELKEMYKNIKLPKRSTTDSAGYDFFAPFSFELCPGTTIKIPTGIRTVFTNPNWGLFLFPRSGIGSKTGIRLTNTVGVVDADYFKADNEGHIFVFLDYPPNPNPASFLTKWRNLLGINRNTQNFEAGKAFCQGIFLPYGVTIDDDKYIKDDRCGGLGSTDCKPPKHHHHHHRPCDKPNHSIPHDIIDYPSEIKKFVGTPLVEYFWDNTLDIALPDGTKKELLDFEETRNSIPTQEFALDACSSFEWGQMRDIRNENMLYWAFELGAGRYDYQLWFTEPYSDSCVSRCHELKVYTAFCDKDIELDEKHHKKLTNHSHYDDGIVHMSGELFIDDDNPIGSSIIKFEIPRWNSTCMRMLYILITDKPDSE